MNRKLMILALLLPSLCLAKDLRVSLYKTTNHKLLGTVVFEDTKHGLLIKPNLKGLQPGIHGFHIHSQPDCGNKGKKAQGHYSLKPTDSHQGPYESGHKGDLPALIVNKDGRANLPLLAPRLKVSDLYAHALIVHAGGDNYSDQPESLGGGGPRVACGVIKKE